MNLLNRTTNFLYLILLLNIGLMMNICLLQAMEPIENESDDQALAPQLSTLKIAQKKSYKLFAERYIELINEIKYFQTFSQEQKKVFLQNFLKIARELASAQGSLYPNRLDLVIKLGQKSLESLITCLGDDAKKQSAQKIQAWFSQNSAASSSAMDVVETMLDFCHREYRNLSLLGEKIYIEILQNIFKKVVLKDAFERILLIQLLNSCDTDFKQQEESQKDLLSLRDLRDDIHRLYGYKPELPKVLDSEESSEMTIDKVVQRKQCNEYGQSDEDRCIAFVIIMIFAMIFVDAFNTAPGRVGGVGGM